VSSSLLLRAATSAPAAPAARRAKLGPDLRAARALGGAAARRPLLFEARVLTKKFRSKATAETPKDTEIPARADRRA
jgi:hypothetical protein